MHTEKSSRDSIEFSRVTLLAFLSELRDLTRPVRRHSHYPTFIALENAFKKLKETAEETRQHVEHLNEQLMEIRERARRERITRS